MRCTGPENQPLVFPFSRDLSWRSISSTWFVVSFSSRLVPDVGRWRAHCNACPRVNAVYRIYVQHNHWRCEFSASSSSPTSLSFHVRSNQWTRLWFCFVSVPPCAACWYWTSAFSQLRFSCSTSFVSGHFEQDVPWPKVPGAQSLFELSTQPSSSESSRSGSLPPCSLCVHFIQEVLSLLNDTHIMDPLGTLLIPHFVSGSTANSPLWPSAWRNCAMNNKCSFQLENLKREKTNAIHHHDWPITLMRMEEALDK